MNPGDTVYFVRPDAAGVPEVAEVEFRGLYRGRPVVRCRSADGVEHEFPTDPHRVFADAAAAAGHAAAGG